MRSTPIIVIISLLLAVAATAQVPGAANLDSLALELCIRDSLYIISPDVVDLELQEEGRFGLMLSWDDLPLEKATCFALRGVDTLGIDASASGGFGDRVDRLLQFTATGEGMVGADQAGSLVLGWRNVGDSTYGNLAGILNLVNNGGIVGWDQAGSGWVKTNTGLPVTWRQINVVDMDIAEDDVMYAAFSAGTTIETESRGLYRHNGTGWTRLAEDVITDTIVVTAVAVSPANSNRIAVGTSLSGLFISSDGGVTFTQWTVEFDPGLEDQPESFRVTALDWTGQRITVAIRTHGLFISNDNGGTFARSDLLVPDDLDKLSPTPVLPQINEVISDPSDPDRILAALQFHGCYESSDGGVTWQDLYGDLLVPDPDDNGAWVRSGLSVAVDPGDPLSLVMGVEQWGLYQTSNGGLNWTLVGENVQPDPGRLRRIKLIADPATAGRFLAMEDGWSLLVSDDSGLNWTHFPVQPTLNSMLTMAVKRSGGGGGDFFVGTWKGGLYEAGMPITLSDTYSSETSSELRSLVLGLDITIHSGTLSDHAGDPDRDEDTFDLVGQTFQGWCVWRSTADNPDTMTMIGKYDRVNPESCIEGFCGDINFQPLPQCYHSTRASCFDFIVPATPGDPLRIRFFDNEVYNAFRYNYAVTTFDYANTAEVSPEAMPRDMVLSPRWPTQAEIEAGNWRRDPLSIFSLPPYLGAGNRQPLQLDRSAPAVGEGEGIYVFPNPLRNDSGIPGEEGRTVIFTNLPAGSHVRVFTTAGDDVAALGTEFLSGGQIRWDTTNRDGESVAAGVYLYMVEIPGQDENWGRLVIIR